MSAASERIRAALEGRYDLLGEVGAGGMATVYLAADVKHGRRVALKVLHPDLAAALGSERFLAEIRTTATLQHPNILPLFDSGEAGGVVFYVMPFVEGESLRQRLTREQQLPVDDAVRIAQQVAGALDYAHRHGVIHRDIKPENILLSEGQPLVADFGVALAVSAAGGTRLTQSGITVGTPAYMSPEQAAAEREVDRRSDVYALGAVLYEMLAGVPPYVGATAAVITARKLTESVPPLRTIRDTVPGAMEQVIRKALARTPADRFGTVQQFADALEMARSLAVAEALTPSTIAAAAQSRAPGRALLPWAVAAVAVAVAVFTRFAGRQSRSGDAVLHLSVNTPAGTAIYAYAYDNIALSPNGSTVVFTAGHGDSTQLFVRALDSYQSKPIPGTQGGDGAFFSPDGRWVGFWLRGEHKLMKVALAGGAPIQVTGDLGIDPVWGAWAPNDTIYAINSLGADAGRSPRPLPHRRRGT